MRQRAGITTLTGLALGSGVVLATRTPHLTELARGLSAPHRWIALAGPDAAVASLAGAALWLIAVWVAGCLLLSAGALLPGRAGALAHGVAARCTPAVLRRVVVAATGASILLGPAAALAAPAASPAPATASAALPAVGWPTDLAPAHPPNSSNSSAPEHAAPGSAAGRLTVRAGDSLWSIAARRLGSSPTARQVQQEWPRWYAGNRRLIGADPGLIRPGTRLLVPPAEPARTEQAHARPAHSQHTQPAHTDEGRPGR